MKKLKAIKTIAVILFLISLFCTVDLGLSCLFNAGASYHDGYWAHSLLHAAFGIFGDSAWTFDNICSCSSKCSFALCQRKRNALIT